MIVNFYSIFDTKIEKYTFPTVARNDREATVQLLRSGVPKALYEDCKLFCVGSFDDEQGLFVPEKREVALIPYPSDKETM